MEYRPLGKTRLKISVMGVGAEHLKNIPSKEITKIINTALDAGINYFDLVWNLPNIIEGFSCALDGWHEKVNVAFHLGSCIKNGKYMRSRDPVECEQQLKGFISQLRQNIVPVLNIHYVANTRVWHEVNRKGIVALAERLKSEGLVEAVSISTHEPEVIKQAAQSGAVDSIMYQVNATSHTYRAAGEALGFCKQCGIGVIAMKPFAGGELLKVGKDVKIPAYKTGWKTMSLTIPACSTPVRLLSYTLNQPGVCTAVTGVSSSKELTENLAYLTSSKEEKDYTALIEELCK